MMDKPVTNEYGERLDHQFDPGMETCRREGILFLLGHGVTGNKDRPILVETADALNRAGFDTLRFSFSGNGHSEGGFEKATISRELNDLKAILDALPEDYTRIGYIGHSMGAAVGVLKAASDARIDYLISLAGMVDTHAFAQTEFGDLVPDEDVMWEEVAFPLSQAFMTDLCETVRSVAPQAEQITIPWLLVHGTGDDVVLPRDSKGIKEQLGKRVDLVLIEGANHVFSEPEHLKAATTAVVGWVGDRV
ncbi:MAG TPA: alpha/beta fold hydrolase [Oceanipulchritudo sp.]|nr:alpha/beta fold hydrolase [Oceanipulchritudo sp.]